MTLTNFDASQVALRKKQKALALWQYSNIKLVNDSTSVRAEQPTFQSGEVVSLRKQGVVVCGCLPSTADASTTYQFNGLSQGTPVNF